MDRIAIFSDIHGNLPALEAVLEDMDQRGIERRYCLGDLVGYGTFPNEVIERIQDLKIPTIMGNYDQGVGNNSDECGCAYRTADDEALGKRSIAWSNANTSDENKAFLRSLPAQIPLKLRGSACPAGTWQPA
jgi:predicted phosphodiesterase